ncbi:MAG TPA: site-specific integrase [Gaiellaceae bacterium]|nr:site-specific integrase [Gaiellaceae bacterium]
MFTKGGKVQTIRVVDDWWWEALSILQLSIDARPEHYMMCSHKTWRAFVGYDRVTGAAKTVPRHKQFPEKPMSQHGMHDWWYGCLQRAGVVAEGVTRGEKMHKARHTAGQRVLDKSGNIKAVQKLLGHSDPATTMEHYVDWDEEQLAKTMEELED